MERHLVTEMPQQPVKGDEYFDLSDGTIKVPGEKGIHVFGKAGGSGSDSSVVETIDLSSPTETGKAWVYQLGFMKKENATNESDIKVVSLSKGDIVVLASANSLVAVPICVVSSDNTKVVYDTGLRGDTEGNTVSYMATEDCFVALTYMTDEPHSAYIVKSAQHAAVADAVVSPAFLHRVYRYYGAVYNSSTGFWELNGLTDMTEEDMFNCYMALFNYGNMSYRDSMYHTLVDFGAVFNGKCRTYFDNAASKQVYAALDCGVCGKNMFYENSKLEVLAFGNGSYIPKVIGAADGMFYGCSKLRDAGYWNFQYATFDSRDKGMFWSCDSLSRIYLYRVNIDLDLEDSPLLHYDSLSYLINNAATWLSEITVTVHPNTYSYLNGSKTPPPEVGGTSSGWTSLRQTALNNNITFA